MESRIRPFVQVPKEQLAKQETRRKDVKSSWFPLDIHKDFRGAVNGRDGHAVAIFQSTADNFFGLPKAITVGDGGSFQIGSRSKVHQYQSSFGVNLIHLN